MKKTDNIQTSKGEMVAISHAEYEKLQAQSKRISELESRVDMLMEALRIARHKQFDASSEKSEDTLMEQLSFLFNEAEGFSAAEMEAEENVTVVAAHKRHKKHEYTLDNIPEDMPKERGEHRLEGEDLVYQLFCMNTSRDEVRNIQKNSSQDTRDTSIRMVMPDTTAYLKK